MNLANESRSGLPAKIISSMLLIVAIIHLLPVSGVLGAERLTALYGLDFTDPNLALLMQHRAILFGILGLFLLYAIVKPSIQAHAIITAYISVVSFLLLAWFAPNINPQIQRVAIADIVALICLVVASIAFVMNYRIGTEID